jgi:DNA-binding CsgD family transcriptional regulator
MSSGVDSKLFPRSVRQKQILDVAEEHPDAAIDELASMVSSATPELVEEVLAEHGDPASKGETSAETGDETAVETATAGDSDGSDGGPVTADGGPDPNRRDGTSTDGGESPNGDTESAPVSSLEDLSEKQREVLTEVATRPEATQQEIARRLDVSRATVSNRVNSIDGFEWSERESFVEAVFGQTPPVGVAGDGGSASEVTSSDTDVTEVTGSPSTRADGAPAETRADLEATLERLQERVAELEASHAGAATDGDSVFEDPELVHKVVHACMNADTISESEELRILEALLR